MRLALLCLLVAVAAGCTAPLSLDSAWQPGARDAAPFASVLVVAISEDFDRRRLFENAVADSLNAQGVRAVTSTAAMSSRDELNRESVTARVRETGVEAVLVTRLVDQAVNLKRRRPREVQKGLPPTDDALRAAPAFPYGSIHAYDYRVTWEPATLLVRRTLNVVTDLYGTRDGNLLYTINTTIRVTNAESLDRNSDVAVINDVGLSIARRLRRDGAVGDQS